MLFQNFLNLKRHKKYFFNTFWSRRVTKNTFSGIFQVENTRETLLSIEDVFADGPIMFG